VKVIVSEAALADLRRLHDFLNEKNPGAAERAAETLVRAIDSLDHFPERGRPSGTPGVREFVVPFGRSGYVMRYSYLGDFDEVVILRVWHGREQRD
jgi:plasmid stabilization system protein ParE